jgi:hypothetical protein
MIYLSDTQLTLANVRYSPKADVALFADVIGKSPSANNPG